MLRTRPGLRVLLAASAGPDIVGMEQRRRRSLWCAIALALAASPALPLSAQHGAARLSDLELRRLGERFQTTLDSLYEAAQLYEETFPGATAAFALPDGTIIGFATGYSDVEAGVPMEADMRMPAGSIGKTFAAATALSMARDGLLSLDDPLSKWLGARPWFGRLPNGPDITLRHLLNHSAGLIDHAFDSESFVAAVRARMLPDPDHFLRPPELVAFALDQEPLFPAGRGFNYTDTGYILLGMALEAASGSSYYDELRRRILEPLSLDMTHPQDRRDAPALAQGYAVASQQLFGVPLKVVEGGRLVFHPGVEWTGGGLYSNPQDLVRWARALYEGRAIEGPYVETMLTSVPAEAREDPEFMYGLGVVISEGRLGRTYGHSGFFPGYNSRVMYFPAHGMAVALQINADQTRVSVHAETLAQVVIGALHGR